MNSNRAIRGRIFARAVSVVTLAALLFIGARLTLAAPPQVSKKLTITTKSLPTATVGVEYYARIEATGGELPYDCSGTGLPPNITFHYTSDTLGGKATTPGTYPVIVTVTDSAEPAHKVTATFNLTVVAAK